MFGWKPRDPGAIPTHLPALYLHQSFARWEEIHLCRPERNNILCSTIGSWNSWDLNPWVQWNAPTQRSTALGKKCTCSNESRPLWLSSWSEQPSQDFLSLLLLYIYYEAGSLIANWTSNKTTLRRQWTTIWVNSMLNSSTAEVNFSPYTDCKSKLLL